MLVAVGDENCPNDQAHQQEGEVSNGGPVHANYPTDGTEAP